MQIAARNTTMSSSQKSTVAGGPPQYTSLPMPASPAARGYMRNPYQYTADEAHNLLDSLLAPGSSLLHSKSHS